MLIRFLNAGIWLDVVGTINQSESCVEVCGGARRGAWRCVEVCGGARRGAQSCVEVHGGVWRCTEGCMEVFQRGGGEKNQDFMLIRFLNAGIWLDVVGTINQSESCAEVHGGVYRYGEVCAGAQRFVEVHGGVHRGVQRCVEVCGGVHGGVQRCPEVHGAVCGGFSEVVGKKSGFYDN